MKHLDSAVNVEVVLGVAFVLATFNLAAGQTAANLAPTRSEVLALVSKARKSIDEGHHRAGRTYLRAAMSLHKSDHVNGHPADEQHRLTESALAFGRQQFTRLANDRPAIVKHAGHPEFKSLENWAVRAFAGGLGGKRLEWDPDGLDTSTRSLTAFHPVRDPLIGGKVTIALVERRGPQGQYEIPLSFESSWESLVYVLCEASYSVPFIERITSQIERGLTSRGETIERFASLDLSTIHSTQQFYADVFLPFASEVQIRSIWFYWHLGDEYWCNSAAEILANNRLRGNYEAAYGAFFDRVRARNNPGLPAAKRK